MSARFIDVYVLQSVPPSCINRDDTGAPKSAVYGGVQRSRVSSQAWKKATRLDFEKHLDRSELGVRTKRAVELISDEIARIKPELEEGRRLELASGVLTAAKLKVKAPRSKNDQAPGPDETDYLIFFSREQIKNLAALAATEEKPSAKEAMAAADSKHGIEVSLFGRMIADNTALNVDASVQVAHAISTHAAEIESDYFTAVDDVREDDEQGAGMIGVVDFMSSTLYRYAAINVEGLRTNLGDDTATVRAAQAFVRAFALSMPTGKQNTFANRTVPAAVVIAVREDQPVNLVGAFEDPVRAKDSGLVKASSERLAQQLSEVESFVAAPIAVLVSTSTEAASSLVSAGTSLRFDDVISELGRVVSHNLEAQ